MHEAWRTRYQELAAGNAGTVTTLETMRRLAQDGARSPAVIRAAHEVVRHVPERNDDATIAALLRDVRQRMRYTPDPLDTELVKAPEFLIERTNGEGPGQRTPEPMDCDDVCTLLASLLACVGIPSRFVVVAADKSRPDWSHVYVQAQTSAGRVVSLDPIVRAWPAGQEVPADCRQGPAVAFDGPAPSAAVSGIGASDMDEDFLAQPEANIPFEESARVTEGRGSVLDRDYTYKVRTDPRTGWPVIDDPRFTADRRLLARRRSGQQAQAARRRGGGAGGGVEAFLRKHGRTLLIVGGVGVLAWALLRRRR
jgi:hypothetical protein